MSGIGPTPLTNRLTPSQAEINFYEEPRRYYEVRSTIVTGEIDANDWVEVPSVTTVLNVLAKDALTWWGQDIGVQGCLTLWERQVLARASDGRLAIQEDGVWAYADKDKVVEALKQQKLTTNDVRDVAGERGTSAHRALEAWAVDRTMPVANDYDPAERPYIRALLKWCEDVGENFQTSSVEVMVASLEHGFAGTYDLRGETTGSLKLVSRALRKDGKAPLKRGQQHVVIPEGTKLLIDAKTSKGIYETFPLQLAAYEGAGQECGYKPSDERYILHLSAHGVYQFVRSEAAYEDFLAVLGCWRAMQRVKAGQ